MLSTPSADLAPLLAAIAGRIGPQHVLTDPSDMAPYLREERGLYHGQAPAVLRPGSTEEVAFVVEACARAGVPIVPQDCVSGAAAG